MSIETQTHASNGNGAIPMSEWADVAEESEGFSLDRPEIIAAVAFAAGVLVALLLRRRGE